MNERERPERPLTIPVMNPDVLASLDMHREIAALVQQTFARQQRELADAVASIAQSPALQVLDAFRQTFANAVAPLGQVALVNSTYIAQIAQSVKTLSSFMPDLRIAPLSATFLEYLRDMRPLERRAARELALRGWWLVPSWSPDFLLDLMAERERKRCSIGPLLVRRYRKQRCRELGRVVRSWTLPEFSADRRKSLFADAVKQYRRREFRAVILSIQPQVEGILKDFLLDEGLATTAEADGKSTVQLFTSHVLSEREPSMRGFATQLELLYSHFVWSAPAPGSRVRRHPQAHGREVPRKSEQEALRMWLMLETLHFHLARVRRARAAGAA